MKMQYGNYTFVLTSSVSPEQYDVYTSGDLVGRVRIRWGNLRAHSLAEDLVYDYQFARGQQCMFDTHEQREQYLEKIGEAFAAREMARQ